MGWIKRRMNTQVLYSFSCALLVQTLVVPRLNFCLRLQCLGSFSVFAHPPTHRPDDPLRVSPAHSSCFETDSEAFRVGNLTELQPVHQCIGSGSVLEWGPAFGGVVYSAPVHTNAGLTGLGDTSALPSQVLYSVSCALLVQTI